MRETLNIMSFKTSVENFLKEFKAFAMKGNVVDLAVAVVIGGAFGKIVTSFVSDIITPLMSLLTSGVDISKAHWVLREGTAGQPDLILEYGKFGQSITDFIIIAFFIFLAIKLLSKLRSHPVEETPPAAKSAEVQLLEEIRDLLKKETPNTPS